MAIKTENIVYNIQTTVNELSDALTDNSKKVAALDTDIKDAEKTANVAFSKMGQSAKAYGEKIQEAERNQKRLSNTIKEQEQITQEFQRELLVVQERLRGVGRNTVEFQRLTKEADRLKIAIKDNNVALKSLRIDKRNIDQSVNELKKLEQAADRAGKEVKGAGGGIGEFGNALGTLSPQLGGATSQFEGLVSSLGRLGPGGIAAAGGIAALAGGFLLAKNRIEEFGEDVEVVFDQVSVGINRSLDSIALGFANLFKDDQANVIEKAKSFGQSIGTALVQATTAVFGTGKTTNFLLDLLEATPGLGGLLVNLVDADKIVEEEKKIRKEQEQLTKFRQQQEEIEIANIVRKKELELDIADLRLQFEEDRTRGVRNQEAFNKLLQKTKELTALNVQEARALLEIEIKKNKLTISGDAEKRREQELRANVLELERVGKNQERALEKLNRYIASSDKERVGIINTLKKEIEDLEKKVASALNADDLKKYNNELIATRQELQTILDSLEVKPKLGIFEQAEAELQRLQQLLRKAGTEEEAFSLIGDIINAEKAKKDLDLIFAERKRRLEDQEAFQAEIAPIDLLATLPLGGTLLTDQNKKLIEKQQKAVADEFKKRELEIIGKQQIEDEAKKALQVYAELSRDILRQDIERTDRQIELQRERVSEFQKIAENGNAEQLQLEEERLKELLEKRERYAQRERAISALLVAAANAEAIASGISAVAKGFVGEGAPFTGIANAIALAATIGSTIVALRNATSSIPAFAEGTEYVHRNGAPKGKDTIFARLNEGERVLTTEQNAKLKGISNSKLVEIASEYKLNNMRMKNIWTAGKREDNTDLIRGINRTNKLLEGLNLYADVNEYGLQMGISRAERSMNRRRNLAR